MDERGTYLKKTVYRFILEIGFACFFPMILDVFGHGHLDITPHPAPQRCRTRTAAASRDSGVGTKSRIGRRRRKCRVLTSQTWQGAGLTMGN
jgi:hypothetical protein